MATQAPHQITERAVPGALHERETAPLQASGSTPLANSFRLLDNRCRSRAVSPWLARRGPHLAFQDGDDIKLVALDAKITHVGRSLEADVRVEDNRVSRSHAVIVRHGRFARLLDNRSSSGTYLNGRRIVATNLADGDVVSVGSLDMRYVEIR
jgi:hypothetical protein